MVATKPIDQVVEKWKRKVAGASEDYRQGVTSPQNDWATEAGKAQDRYKSGVTQAAAEGRFGRGVARAGTAKWQKGCIEKGVNRWPEGVAMADDEYRSGMGDVLSTIQSVTLPAKGPKGDPRNYERVKAIGDALHKKKIGK